MSQAELARKLSTTEATVSRYVNGKRNPPVKMVKKIADILQAEAVIAGCGFRFVAK